MSLAQYTGADIESGIMAGLRLTCSDVSGVTRLIFTCYPECTVVAYCCAIAAFSLEIVERLSYKLMQDLKAISNLQ